MTTEQRPTPECDAAIDDSPYYQSLCVMVDADFARDLERQRDEAREELEDMREAIEAAYVQLNYALRLSAASVILLHVNNATDKLQPFIKP